MKKPKTYKINDTTYCMIDGLNRASIYLLTGKEKALLIDTGNGDTDLKAKVEELTDLPVIVVNTHGHFDHTRGNYLFGEAYISNKEAETLSRHNDPDWVVRLMTGELPKWAKILFLRKLRKSTVYKPWKALPLPEEGYFELGDKRIAFFETPGHTPGSISLMDKENRILFTGDTTCSGVLLNLEESADVETFRDTLIKILQAAEENNVDTIYTGHTDSIYNQEFLRRFIAHCNDLLNSRVPEEVLKSGISKQGNTTLKFKPDMIRKK